MDILNTMTSDEVDEYLTKQVDYRKAMHTRQALMKALMAVPHHSPEWHAIAAILIQQVHMDETMLCEQIDVFIYG